MRYLALYLMSNQCQFLTIKTFKTEPERRAFNDALNYNAKQIGVSDTEPFVTGFKLPEQLRAAAEIDATIEKRFKKHAKKVKKAPDKKPIVRTNGGSGTGEAPGGMFNPDNWGAYGSWKP